MKKYPLTVDALMTLDDVPVVAIDQESNFTYLNDCFVEEYGWTREDLLGKSVGLIMPPHMRSAHAVGFARYLATEKSELLGKPLPLSVLYKDGRVTVADHYILSKKKDSRWSFAAIIDYPKTND